MFALKRHEQEILRELQERAVNGTLAGIYDNIPIDVYHHPQCPGISSTTIKSVLRSLEFFEINGVKQTSRLRFGSAFHCFSLEPARFQADYYVKKDKKDRGPDDGRIVMSSNDFECIRKMDWKLREHPDASKLLYNAKVEHTAFIQCRITGLWKKCRMDAWKGIDVSDLKSTVDASPKEFARTCAVYGYPISGAYYTGILDELLSLRHNFNLIACENEEPFGINVFRLSDRTRGRAEVRITEALQTLKRARENPEAWRGYPLGIKELEVQDYF